MRTAVAVILAFMLGGSLGLITAALVLAREDGTWRWDVAEDERHFTGGEW